MSKLSTATFSGKKGKYEFTVYTADTNFKDVGAVYIFTKRTVSKGNGTHDFLYIGETGELGTRIPNHEKWPCVKKNGCNCICVHNESSEKKRLEIEKDLRDAKSTPCNDQ